MPSITEDSSAVLIRFFILTPDLVNPKGLTEKLAITKASLTERIHLATGRMRWKSEKVSNQMTRMPESRKAFAMVRYSSRISSSFSSALPDSGMGPMSPAI